jgi:uracil-DNA glycosylase family 4
VTFKDKFNKFIDGAGLIIALLVQLAVMTVSLLKLAPSTFEAIGFVTSGIAIVMFAPRAFSKWMTTKKWRYLINYIMLEFVTLFFGWSFMLTGTILQTQNLNIVVTESNDVVLSELLLQRDQAQTQLEQKLEEFDQATRESTVANIQTEQANIQEELRTVNRAIIERKEYITTGQATQDARQAADQQSADKIFSSIPDALAEGKWVHVVIWFMFVGSISLMIINTLHDQGTKEEEEKMPGFIDIVPDKPVPRVQVVQKVSGCETCAAYRHCKTPKIAPIGEGKKDILLVFGSPTKHEDSTGKPFSDQEYQYLFSILDSYGVHQEDVTVTHAVQCYQSAFAEKDVSASPQAIAGCHQRLMQTIQNTKPEKIFVFGTTAMRVLYHNVHSGRFSFNSFDKFPGYQISDQEIGAVVIPVFDPFEAIGELKRRKKNILKYNPDATFNKQLWKDKIKDTDSFRLLDRFIRNHIMEGLKAKYRKFDIGDAIVLENDEQIISFLRYVLTLDKIAFDIETTGLKPYADGQEIVTWGFSDGESMWAFRHPDSKRVLRLLSQVMESDVKKYGWNIQYEHIWIRHFLGIDIKNWDFDGMIGTHVLDNRPGITSLKFQTFVRFGIAGYDSEIDEFLKSSGGCSALNNIKMAPIDKLLLYNAMDAKYTYLINEQMQKEMKAIPYVKKGYNLFHKGQIALAEMSLRGFVVDEIQLEKNYMELDKRAMMLYKKIMAAPEIKGWKGFNPGSSTDLAELFYTRLEYEITERTDRGQPSTKSDVLENFYKTYGIEIAKDIAEYKTILQTRDTFLEGIKQATWGDEIHPSYSLNLVASYRSSSQNPNFQNHPKRDLYAMGMIRSVLKPKPGYVFIDVDYKSLEAYVGAAYHKDSNMISYLMDESVDIHADTAQDLFMCKKEDVPAPLFKKMRQVGKTGGFSLLYGSSARKFAFNLWHGHMDAELKDFVADLGIDTYTKWEQHCREIYRIYWEDRFSELYSWRNSQWQNYIKTGEVRSYTGFRYNTRMTMNQVGNYSQQGSGFHLLLNGIILLNGAFKKEKMDAGFVAEIHDSAIIEARKEDVERVKDMIRETFIIENKRQNKWMTMPLEMSGEIYEKNWAEAVSDSEFELIA